MPARPIFTKSFIWLGALKSGADSQFILTHEQQVQLCAPGGVWIDLEEFEGSSIRCFRSGSAAGCEEALALYGGDLLNEDLYVDWCARKRDQLRASHQELLMKLGSLYAEQQRHELAIRQFEKVVTAEPSNEEAHRELMRLYVLTGRRSEALRQFQRCCDSVRDGLRRRLMTASSARALVTAAAAEAADRRDVGAADEDRPR